MDEYKLQFDHTAGWVVMRRSKKGWVPFKYPGKDMKHVAHTLINLSLDGVEVSSIEELVNVYETAADRVCEALKELVSR